MKNPFVVSRPGVLSNSFSARCMLNFDFGLKLLVYNYSMLVMVKDTEINISGPRHILRSFERAAHVHLHVYMYISDISKAWCAVPETFGWIFRM